MKLRKTAALLLSAALSLLPTARCAAAEAVELPVIMYHHVLKNPKMWGDYVIPPDMLEGDLQYLRDRGYTAISVRELIAYAEGRGELPEKPVMITFDDGQASFAEYAIPLLEKYDMCAVAAIVGKYADIYTENDDRNVSYAYMSWPELAEISKNPHVELQAHTYDMHSLSSRRGCSMLSGESPEAYRAAFGGDLERLNARFEQYLGFVPEAFAYPYGIKCPECTRLLLDTGYKAISSCDERVNHISRDDPACLHDIGRFNRPYSADRQAFFTKLGIS